MHLYIVGDGLKELDESIARVRDAVRYVKSSPNRLETFKKCVHRLKIDSKSLLCLDVPTRWNSTYRMLESAEKFEKVFERLEDEDPIYKGYFGDTSGGCPPTEEDWEKCRVFVKFLRLFYLATKRFSGSTYVTSNTFIDEIVVIHSQINQLIRARDHVVTRMAVNMKAKFEKYWGNGDKINMLLYIAVVLDPRRKLTYLHFCFNEMYDDVVAKALVDKVKVKLIQLYEHYASISSPHVPVQSSSGIVRMEVDVDDPHKVMASKYKSFLEGQLSGCKNELEKYLAENPEGANEEKFDILGWWKHNSIRYPLLSQVARNVLAVPISTVASESAFSTGGRILDSFRSSLSPLMVQSLVCTQNWLQATVPPNLRNTMDFIEELEEALESGVLESESSSNSRTVDVLD